MRRYPNKFKEELVRKCDNRAGESIRSVAQSNGIGYSTLLRWQANNRREMGYNPVRSRTCDFSESERQELLLKSKDLSGVDLGAFCRRNGVFLQEIESWSEEIMSAETEKKEDIKQLHKDLKKERRKTKKLKKQLAEAEALLELKKKADLIWGVKKEDS